MLPKKNRLTRIEINNLRQNKPLIIQGRCFGLIYRPKSGEQKFGVIISGKISKKAVLRNQTKRRLFQAIENRLLDKKGWFLFLAKRPAIEASVEDFERELTYFKGKIKV